MAQKYRLNSVDHPPLFYYDEAYPKGLFPVGS